MTSRLALPSLAVVVALFGAGCGRYDDPGDVTLSWTFGGKNCAGSGVAEVRVAIPGEVITGGNGTQADSFTCLVQGSPGVVLPGFAGGRYTVNLTAFDANGTPIYQGSKDFGVNGSIVEAVDLSPIASAPASLALSWTFNQAITSYTPQCGTSDPSRADNIDQVSIFVDNATTAAATFNCADGLNGTVFTPSLPNGAHQIQLTAYNSVLNEVWAQSDPVTVQVSPGVGTSVPLAWQVGGIALSWALYPKVSTYRPGDPPVACSSAVAGVSVEFQDANGVIVGRIYSPFNCDTPATFFSDVPPGVYNILITAFDANNNPLYIDRAPYQLQTTIQPNVFFDGQNANVQFVPLFAQ